MKHNSLYTDWSNRISHLETLRHGLIVIHMFSLGYLAIRTAEGSFIIWRSSQLLVCSMVFAGFWLFFISMAEHNLFLKAIILATQLMRIEKINKLYDSGLNYYSGRVGKDKRFGYLIFGFMPDLLSASWYLLVFIVAPSKIQCFARIIILIGFLFFIGIACWHGLVYIDKLREKDKMEQVMEMDV